MCIHGGKKEEPSCSWLESVRLFLLGCRDHLWSHLENLCGSFSPRQCSCVHRCSSDMTKRSSSLQLVKRCVLPVWSKVCMQTCDVWSTAVQMPRISTCTLAGWKRTSERTLPYYLGIDGKVCHHDLTLIVAVKGAHGLLSFEKYRNNSLQR